MLGMKDFLGKRKALKTPTSTFFVGVTQKEPFGFYHIFCAANFLRHAQESSLSYLLQSQRGTRVLLKKIRHKDGFKQWQTLRCQGTLLL